MLATAQAARPSRVPIHFWPGAGDAEDQAGALTACQREPRPLHASAELGAVTCKTCRASTRFRYFEGATAPVILGRAALVDLGFLRADAPPPVKHRPPYRNPRLVERSRDPLPELVRSWDAFADGSVTPVTGPLSREQKAIFRSCASELAALVQALRKGEP